MIGPDAFVPLAAWNARVSQPGKACAQVGVDVVEATLMVVEHAERFGLAALHQLRGRVGRGGRKSHCYLLTPERRALQRLRIMERSQDGFLIAQADLEHRCADDRCGPRRASDCF